MEITWKTEIEELLKVSDVEDIASEYLDEYNNVYFKTVTKEMDTQTTSTRGFGPNAFSICGESPIYLKANIIKNKIESLGESVTALKADIISAAVKQRKKELKELREAYNNHLSKLKQELDQAKQEQKNLVEEWEKYSNDIKAYATSFSAYCANPFLNPKPSEPFPPNRPKNWYDIPINIKNKEIEHFEEKKRAIQSALGKIGGA